MTMTLQKNVVTGALALASAVGLVACGGGDSGTQDVGTNNAPTPLRTVSARAVDGYLAGATVYVDQNTNGQLDSFEPRAITDTDGYFSYNHVTKTDYCAAGASESLARYCLQAQIAADAELTIRVTGGYDTVTKMPFKGTLSVRSKDLDSSDMRLVTPLTSMASESLSAEEKYQALVQAGIFGGTDKDYIADLDGPMATRAQFATIVAKIMGEAADAGTGQTFEDIEGDAWYGAYTMIAQRVADMPGPSGSGIFETAFKDTGAMMDMVRKLSYKAMSSPDLGMPDDFKLQFEDAAVAILVPMAEFAKLSDELSQRLGGMAQNREALAAALRLQAIMAERFSQNPADPELGDLISWGENQLAQGSGLGSDLTQLGGDNIDPSALVDPSFDFDPTSNSISASATLPPEVTLLFSALLNSSFQFSLNDSDKQGAALVFLKGQSGATSGELDICVRYNDTKGDFDTGSASDPNGALLVNGNWSLIDGHTLMLNADIAGGVRPLVLKAVGVNGLDREYRFDFGGDLSKWTGTAPASFSPGTEPTDDASCKTALIDRFGATS
jgi:hypothetical protein